MTNEREARIDGQLADLWNEAAGIRARIEANRLSLAHAAGIRPTYETRKRREVYIDGRRATTEQLIEAAKAAQEGAAPYRVTEIQRTLDSAEAHRIALEANYAAAAPLEAEYNAAPWSRFFLVTNAGGHIHSTMACSTCRPTTCFAWLPTLSGLTEKDAVDAHGPHLCSVCFPTAPVEWRASDEPEADPDRCPGSGTHDHDSSGLRYYSPRARCNHCHATVSVTSTGKMRKHKKEVTA